MEVALSTYFKAEEAARVAVIDEVSATLRAMAEGDFATPVPDLPTAFAELQKHLDGGCPVMFHTVKGKPNHRVITNLFGDMAVINKMFGWESDAARVRALARALRKPIRPEIIDQKDALVQEHVILDPKDPYTRELRAASPDPELHFRRLAEQHAGGAR